MWYSAASDRLRDAARWLVISFGAVAAAVFAGITLSAFGTLDPTDDSGRFWVAAGAAFVGLVGVLTALLQAMSLAGASTVSLADLAGADSAGARAVDRARAAIEKDPVLTPWGNDVETFLSALKRSHETYADQVEQFRVNPDYDDSVPAQLIERERVKLQSMLNVQDVVLGTASFIRLQHSFARARWVIGGAMAAASIAVIAFVWATGDNADESEAPAEAAVPALVATRR